MTGFARVDGSEGGYSWTWEVKSVNSKGLDMRFRLPSGFDHVETAARAVATRAFARGNLSVNLNLQRPDRPPSLQVNREVLEQMISLVREFGGDGEPSVETLLTLRGVERLAHVDQQHLSDKPDNKPNQRYYLRH